MFEYTARIDWSRGSQEYEYETFSRDHRWVFGSGTTIQATSAPEYLGTPSRVNPEEALVAALSSCHMLTFLAIAARKRFVVNAYRDDAVGFMEKNAEGRLSITRVTLRPHVEFAEGAAPSAEQLKALHEKSHAGCFIANSVRTEVTVEPALSPSR